MKPTPENRMADQLRKWLAGDTGLKEEQELEQLSKEDPFLQEAMEGYRQFPEEDHAAALSKLKKRLQPKKQKGRSVYLYRSLRIAAAIALLLTTGMLWLYLNSDLSPESVVFDGIAETRSQAEAPAIEQDEASTDDTEVVEEIQAVADEVPEESEQEYKTDLIPQKRKETTASELAAEDQAEAQSKNDNKDRLVLIQPEIEEKEIANPKSAIPPPPPATADYVEIPKEPIATAEEAEEPLFDQEEFSLKEEDITEPSPIATVRRDSAPPLSSEKRLIMGVVKGDNGFPLMGAKVIEIGTGNTTITDLNGRFSLQLEQSQNAVEATYNGFESQRLDVSSSDNVEFVLDEDALLLEEVVIVESKKKRSRSSKAEKSLEPPKVYNNSQIGPLRLEESAMPEFGFESFDDYLEDNLKFPDKARENKVKGKVRVQFTVNKDGSLSNFSIIQSLGYGCDEEAIRLLKEGPKWKLLTFNDSIITSYAIEFRPN